MKKNHSFYTITHIHNLRPFNCTTTTLPGHPEWLWLRITSRNSWSSRSMTIAGIGTSGALWNSRSIGPDSGSRAIVGNLIRSLWQISYSLRCQLVAHPPGTLGLSYLSVSLIHLWQPHILCGSLDRIRSSSGWTIDSSSWSWASTLTWSALDIGRLEEEPVVEWVEEALCLRIAWSSGAMSPPLGSCRSWLLVLVSMLMLVMCALMLVVVADIVASQLVKLMVVVVIVNLYHN